MMVDKTDAVYDFSTSNIKLPDWYAQENKEFGCFSPDGKEYVITTPDTPRPWLNYLGNDDYGLVFGNHGEGFSWYKAMTARVTRYTASEYVPREPDSGRGVYLKFKNDDSLVSVASVADQEKSDYCCVHGLGYSVIKSCQRQVNVSWKVFVPLDDSVEVWQIRLENTSKEAKEFSLIPIVQWQLGQYSYSPPCSYNPLSDIDNDLKVIFSQNDNAFIATNKVRQPLDFNGFFKSNTPVQKWQAKNSGITGDVLSLEGIEFDCKDSESEAAVSSFCVDIELKPGECKEFIFVAGVFEQQSDFDYLSNKYDKETSDIEFDRLQKYWDGVVKSNVNIETPEKEVNLWCNVRLKSLLHNTKRWTRGLDRGYRDVLQDLRGYLTIDPDEVRKQLLKTLSFQYSDGRTVRQYSVVGTEHDLRDYSDSPVWIADVLTAYVKETGDFVILDCEVPFFDGGSGSVYEHNLRAIRYLLNDRGEHGLCHIRYGDWNDALEGIGKRGYAEGVWLSMALYWAMNLTHELAEFIHDDKVVKELRENMREVKDAVNESGWQDRWYAYALDDDGKPIGSPDNIEGRLHLNAQTFAIFTGIADDTRAEMCMDAVKEYLETGIGPLLVWPCYQNEQVGRIWRMEPGTFENGSMYFHGAAFKMMADVAIGRSDVAIDTFLKILPSNPKNPLSRSTIEPYALGNYYCGRDNKLSGLNIYSHFTGSYSWMFKCVIEKVIGVEAGYKGLNISPNLPDCWKTVNVKREFCGRLFDIKINRSGNKGFYDIYLDGLLIAESMQSVLV